MRALSLLACLTWCLTCCVAGAARTPASAVAAAAAARPLHAARAHTGPARQPVRYVPPVAGDLVVVRGFAAPPNPYAAGHRGVDVASSPGEPVRAAGTGVVRFAGQVAGRGVVVIAHADGVSTEYEPLRVLVAAGQHVIRGQPIGRVHGRHGSCAPGGCLHWGARRAGRYLDPMLLLRALAPVRLLPWRTIRATRALPARASDARAAPHARGCACA